MTRAHSRCPVRAAGPRLRARIAHGKLRAVAASVDVRNLAACVRRASRRARPRFHARGRTDRLPARSLGLRQDDGAALPRRLRAGRKAATIALSGRVVSRARTARAAGGRRHRHGVPGLRAVSASHASRAMSAFGLAGARRPRRARRIAEMLDARGPRRRRRHLSARALRRPAAARRARPRARAATRSAAARRAVLESRHRSARAACRSKCARSSRQRHDRDPRHARPARIVRARRRDRRHARRPHRAVGCAYKLYHRPAHALRRRFRGAGRVPARRRSRVRGCSRPSSASSGDCAARAPGDGVVDVLLRPDDIVHDDASPWRAEVAAKAFRGAEFLYTLKLASGTRVLSLVPSHHDHAIGEKIGIRLAIDHVVAFPASV